LHPHGPSPAEEQEGRRHWQGPALPGSVLTAGMAEFCQSGISVVLASCDGAPSPVLGRGVACRVVEDGPMRVVLRNASNGALQKALGRGSRLAVTFTQPTTHLSLQLKAPSASIVPADALDVPAAHAQAAKFRRELVAVGYSESFAAAYCGFEPHDLLTITFTPEQAFLQTPGPSAGSALR